MSSYSSPRGRRRRDSYDDYNYNSQYGRNAPPRYQKDDRYPAYDRGRQWYDDNYAYRHESYDSERNSKEATKQPEKRKPRNRSLKDVTSKMLDLVVRPSSRKRAPSPDAKSDVTAASSHVRANRRSLSLADSSRIHSRSRSRSRSVGSRASSVHTRVTNRSHASSAHTRVTTRSRGGQTSGARSERGGDKSRKRDKSKHGRELDHSERIKQALLAGLAAGAVEAIRVLNEPGPWRGPKGRRVATAAFSAAAIEAAIDKHPDHNPNKKAVIARLGGLVMSRLINGPTEKQRKGKRR
ncbi:hypothetical protein MGG_10006 [Pyricularia oryzae 70-15]|uniref:Uncharacterized protein n=1 Tax=Pyricularia oryzae (strain 70-15 / ATCC MYA-4617 / FGSC 8958) TaxID=242507 RepID=G4N9E0_PYRO7|nr:uncharacterized protein MGG_10006 [Pyricularia oryzae 70-15]EHA51181.1 hypothetical protein MGG_10006 [Pyricularia oryzae 70-15]